MMSLNKHSVTRVRNGARIIARLDERENSKTRQRSRRLRRALKESGHYDAEHHNLVLKHAR